MSTYLVAFANGIFEHIESSYVSPLSGKTRPLRIYGKLLLCLFNSSSDEASATSEYIKQAEFALDIKRRVLPLYEQMFDVEYPLPKLDTLIVCKSPHSFFYRQLLKSFRQVISTLALWRTGYVLEFHHLQSCSSHASFRV